MNQPPVIGELQAACEEVAPGEQCAVRCSARDPDGDALSYNWSASRGDIVGDGARVEWRAPELEGLFRIGVEVSDGNGGRATDSVTISVRANLPPVIQGLDASRARLQPGESCRIECKAEDPEGEWLQYDWLVNGGKLFDRGSIATWVAPGMPGVYEIGVIVRDDEGALATRVLPISVTLPGAPTLEGLVVTPIGHNLLKESNGSYRVFRSRDYSIECLADGTGQLTYEWQAGLGTLSGSGALVEWRAPPGKKEGMVRVMVSDEWGRTATGAVVLQVETCSICI
ncbi:MAG: Ig-like domain-containing protein [Chloroflexota bacterium]